MSDYDFLKLLIDNRQELISEFTPSVVKLKEIQEKEFRDLIEALIVKFLSELSTDASIEDIMGFVQNNEKHLRYFFEKDIYKKLFFN